MAGTYGDWGNRIVFTLPEKAAWPLCAMCFCNCVIFSLLHLNIEDIYGFEASEGFISDV